MTTRRVKPTKRLAIRSLRIGDHIAHDSAVYSERSPGWFRVVSIAKAWDGVRLVLCQRGVSRKHEWNPGYVVRVKRASTTRVRPRPRTRRTARAAPATT